VVQAHMIPPKLRQKKYGLPHEASLVLYRSDNMRDMALRKPFLRHIFRYPCPAVFLECVP
jgi:hypothetical protein